MEELTALGEVGQALSSTLDLETVLNTIVSRAKQLAGVDAASVSSTTNGAEEFLSGPAHNRTSARAVRPARADPKGRGVAGRMAVTLEPVQIARHRRARARTAAPSANA